MQKAFYKNEVTPKPKHGHEGQHRIFNGHWKEDLTYTGDREGSDIYCAHCDHWNTVKGTSILFSVIGKCKNCGTPLNH